MRRDKKDKKLCRAYVYADAHQRLRRLAANYGMSMQDALSTLVLSFVDENGKIREKMAPIDEETEEILYRLASKSGRSISEEIRDMCYVIETLFHERLIFSDALLPISKIREKIERGSGVEP